MRTPAAVIENHFNGFIVLFSMSGKGQCFNPHMGAEMHCVCVCVCVCRCVCVCVCVCV